MEAALMYLNYYLCYFLGLDTHDYTDLYHFRHSTDTYYFCSYRSSLVQVIYSDYFESVFSREEQTNDFSLMIEHDLIEAWVDDLAKMPTNFY